VVNPYVIGHNEVEIFLLHYVHPASSLAQDRESSPVETGVLTTMLRRQLIYVILVTLVIGLNKQTN